MALLEAGVCLAIAGFSVHAVPFRWLGTALRRPGGSGRDESGTDDHRQARRVGWAIRRAVAKSPVRFACLAQSVAAKAMLARRRTPSTLHLGVRKTEQGELAAHAWVLVGGTFVTGRMGHKQFTVVARFD
jgi:Transglutaminase-like superfamily